MKERFVLKRFGHDAIAMILTINEILKDYAA